LLTADDVPFLPAPTEEVEEAEAGRTPPIGGLLIPNDTAAAFVRDLPAAVDVAAGRAIRPAAGPLAMRPAAVVLLVALDGAVRPAASDAIDGLGRP